MKLQQKLILRTRFAKRERGVVLMAALIILLTLTLIGLALIRLSVVELKVAGASQRYQILFNDAETVAALFFYSNQTNLVDGCLTRGYSTTWNNSVVVDQCRFLEGMTNNSAPLSIVNDSDRRSAGAVRIPNLLLDYSRVQLTIEQTRCVDNFFSQIDTGQGNDATAPSAVFFDVEARAWDQLDSDASVSIHTGLVAQMPPGKSCNLQGT